MRTACNGSLESAAGTLRRRTPGAPIRHLEKEAEMRADANAKSGSLAGISLGGIVVIVGVVLMIVSSFWLGLIVTLVGLIAFGGFAKDKWY
jgi:hypothetical protein